MLLFILFSASFFSPLARLMEYMTAPPMPIPVPRPWIRAVTG